MIARTVGVGTSTVYRTKQRFVEEGLDRALSELPRPGAPRKLGATDEALLVAVACSRPPSGRARWTMNLLAGELVRLTAHETLSGDTVGRRLAEMKLKPWQEKMWCIPHVNAEYVARMEDVLDLYADAPDPRRPVVGFDETPRQLIGEARVPVPAEAGKPRRVDYEYVRNGTANVFLCVDVHRPWRHAKVTDQRTCVDFAECMRNLVDEHYPEAERIRVVLDNLSAHSAAALYQAFPPAEARRILSRLEFHFTPKHASWLNMVEIEIGVMVAQCLDRRIPDKTTLITEIAAWERRRNAEKARINWMFTVDRAREKLGRLYPQPAVRTKVAV
jgi:transposase